MIALITAGIVTILCAFFYRFGGCSKEEGKEKYPWVPSWMFASWIRDCGCSLLSTLWIYFFTKGPWWYPLLCLVVFGWVWGMLTTYWDWMFHNDSGWNYWMHGLMVAVPVILLVIWGNVFWVAWLIRCAAVSLIMGGISAASGNVDVEEMGRGAAIGVTLPILLWF